LLNPWVESLSRTLGAACSQLQPEWYPTAGRSSRTCPQVGRTLHGVSRSHRQKL